MSDAEAKRALAKLEERIAELRAKQRVIRQAMALAAAVLEEKEPKP